MNEPPYKAPPKAPVLYIKPANTWSADGADIPVPARVSEVEVGATIAMVMKAAGEVAGYVLMNDLSIPHASFFRPPVKFKCLDGFLGIGGTLLPAGRAATRRSFALEVRMNGELKQTRATSRELVRPRGAAAGRRERVHDPGRRRCADAGLRRRPAAGRAGDRIEISAPGLGTLTQHAGGGGTHEARSRRLSKAWRTTPPSATANCCWTTAGCLRLRRGDLAAAAGADAAAAHHPGPGPELRRPRQGAGVQGAGGAAGLPQGRERADRPPPVHPPARTACSSCTTNASSRW